MKNLIRGGQTSLHSFHMSSQLVFALFKAVVIVVIIGEFYYVSGKFDIYDFKEVGIYLWAEFLAIFGGSEITLKFIGRSGHLYDLKVATIISNSAVIAKKNQILLAIITGFWYGISFAICVVIFLLFLFKYRGKKLSKERFIRGSKIVSQKFLKKIINKYNYAECLKNCQLPTFNYYQIAKIPFPRNTEFLHTVILGSTGTGKTNAILEIVDQIKRNSDRAIIYDKMGTYTSLYYDSSKDIILNPLDARSKSWSFFKEIRNESDYDYMASAFIQEKKGNSDQFWIDAARRVFSVFAKKLKEEKGSDATNQEFVDALLKVGYEDLAQFLMGTEAASLISEKSERTSLSILSILATHISSMKYLRDSDNNFSIRNWVEKDSSDILFISSRGDQHDSLQPLISTWIDIAIKALLSVEQNNPNSSNPRRIWIILDEISSLQKLPSLLDGLSQSRQFGGAFVIGLHSISQLRAVYGRDNTETITSLCRNKLFFAAADPDTAEYCSTNLGYQEIEEVKEGISYGANEIRDGVNLNTQKSNKKIVIAAELLNMRALQAYLKFAGHFPVSKISFKIKKRPKIAERFVDIAPAVSDILKDDNEEKQDPISSEVENTEFQEEVKSAKNDSKQLSLFNNDEVSVLDKDLEEQSEQDDENQDFEEEEFEYDTDEENQDDEDSSDESQEKVSSARIKYRY